MPVVSADRASRSAARRGAAVAWPVAVAAVLVVVAGGWLVADPHAFGTRGATCLDTGCFCERLGSAVLAQPVNAWSSLAFVVAGIAVAVRGRRWRAGIAERTLALGLAAALVAVGVGSLALHGTVTYAGQLLDLQGMYLVGLVLAMGALTRSRRLAPTAARTATIAGIATLAVSQYVLPGTRRWLFGALIALGLLAEARARGWSRPLVSGLLVLAAAYAAWLADDRQWLCDPTSWLQGHAIWHLLGALAGFMLAEHYRVADPGTAEIAGPVRR